MLAFAGLALSQEVVLIPAGKVVIGDYPAGYGNRPAKIATVPDFFIDKTAVTNEAFAKFVDDGGYAEMAYWVIEGAGDSLAGWRWKEAEAIRHPKYWDLNRSPYWQGAPYSGRADTPVIGISWFEAYAYAKWAGKRLPTDEEWEKAARGTSSKFGEWQGVGVGSMYPWGNDFFAGQKPPEYKLSNWRLRYYAYRFPDTDGRARATSYARETWTTDGYREEAAPVLAFSPGGNSPYGVAGMAGNVWEWTITPYPKFEDKLIIIKGGGWYRSTLDHLKAGYIHGMGPYFRGRQVGFRCVSERQER